VNGAADDLPAALAHPLTGVTVAAGRQEMLHRWLLLQGLQQQQLLSTIDASRRSVSAKQEDVSIDLGIKDI
jgi:hypothetical protein